jgi:hypothetical protein
LSFSFSICSLYVGTRSSQPSGALMPSSSDSSACSGTRLWMNSVACAGSMPDASQSISTSHTFFSITSGVS